MKKLHEASSFSTRNKKFIEIEEETNKDPDKHEVDWFRLENRVREMLSGQLQPVVQAIEINSMSSLKNKTDITKLVSRVTDLEYKHEINSTKIQCCEDSIKEITSFKGDMKILRDKVKKDISGVHNSLEDTKARLTNIKEENEALQANFIEFKDQLEQHTETMLNQKSEIYK